MAHLCQHVLYCLTTVHSHHTTASTFIRPPKVSGSSCFRECPSAFSVSSVAFLLSELSPSSLTPLWHPGWIRLCQNNFAHICSLLSLCVCLCEIMNPSITCDPTWGKNQGPFSVPIWPVLYSPLIFYDFSPLLVFLPHWPCCFLSIQTH